MVTASKINTAQLIAPIKYHYHRKYCSKKYLFIIFVNVPNSFHYINCESPIAQTDKNATDQLFLELVSYVIVLVYLANEAFIELGNN